MAPRKKAISQEKNVVRIPKENRIQTAELIKRNLAKSMAKK